MITLIHARNGGIRLHSDNADYDGRIGWSKNPEELAEMVKKDGGLAEFVRGVYMTKGKSVGFSTDDGPEKIWNEVLKLLDK
jgi:hypothetical protein